MNDPTAKILFVNADINILNDLKKLLKDEEWLCLFVTNGSAALECLSKSEVDLVVSATELADYDGIQLQTEIRDRHPEVVRIFLTDQPRHQNVIQALVEGQTQQIIPTPWIDQELKEILRSALRQKKQQRQYSPEFQALINSVPLMPALPESYTNIRSCITGDEINIEKMADFISQDVSFSTALLHWANSALFGQRFQVDSIKKAIIVLGTDIVENLILSESVNRTIAGSVPEVQGFDLHQFKKHSMATAVISRLLIKSICSSDAVKHDRAFVSGLLHDMGKLAAASFFPKRLEKSIAMARKRNCPLLEAETKVYATNHAELGAFLAEWWALPPFIVNAINWHHQPQSTPIERDVIAATYVANQLSYLFDYGACDMRGELELDERYSEEFYLNEDAIEILRAETEKVMMALVR